MPNSSPSPSRSALFDQTNGLIAPSAAPQAVPSSHLQRLVSAAVLGFGGIGR